MEEFLKSVHNNDNDEDFALVLIFWWLSKSDKILNKKGVMTQSIFFRMFVGENRRSGLSGDYNNFKEKMRLYCDISEMIEAVEGTGCSNAFPHMELIKEFNRIFDHLEKNPSDLQDSKPKE